MKNFIDSDYAANKNAKGIVCRFVDGDMEITLEDYLLENPDNTAVDFAELKAWSDEDYYDIDRSGYRQTWKNVSLTGLEDSADFAALSPEDEEVRKAEQIERSAELIRRRVLAQKALDKLTDVQRRRYLLMSTARHTER